MRPSERIVRFVDEHRTATLNQLGSSIDYNEATTRAFFSSLLRYLDERACPRIRFRKMHPDAIVPQYQTGGAAGMDLHARIDGLIVAHGEIAKVGTGIALELPDGFEAQIRPRSGLTSRSIFVQLGTLDSDYRGEAAVTIANFSGAPFTIVSGMRLAQIVFAQVATATLVESDELSATARGERGFGHTGDR
jgi:dUTP pyrophosphatase